VVIDGVAPVAFRDRFSYDNPGQPVGAPERLPEREFQRLRYVLSGPGAGIVCRHSVLERKSLEGRARPSRAPIA
jgi:hypothetical protein